MPAEDRVVVHLLDGASIPEGERFAAWKNSIAQFDVAAIGSEPFVVTARFFQIDPLVFSFQTLGPVEFRRDARLVRSDGADHFSLIMQLDGETDLTIAGGTTRHGAGDALLLDLGRTWTSRGTLQRSIAIQIPRWFLDDVVSPRGCHGPLPATAATRLLVDTAVRLGESVDTMSRAAAAPFARVIRDLLASTLLEMAPVDRERPTSMRQRAIAYLRMQAPGSVTIERMCADLATTRSSLFRTFRDDGGVLAFDRRRRLLDLHRAIADPAEQGSIAQLGYDCGFANKAHLSLLFRDAFGYSPSDLRRYARSSPPNPALRGSVQDRYRQALRSLE